VIISLVSGEHKVEIAFSKSNSYRNWNVQFSFVLYEIIVMV